MDLPDLPDLPERARRHGDVLAARAHGSPGKPGGVRPRLLASWQRSEDYGVSLDEIEPVFTGTYDAESLFYECGSAVLEELHRTLVDEPISLMLTDADGLVLSRLSGDTSLLRALDKVHLAPGFMYSERAAGTNGLGLALADRVPTVVRAEEHYALSLCTYTCAAVPVFDPRLGRLEGCINLTTWSRSSHDLLLALAQSAAGNTSALMLARSQGRRPRPAPRGEVFRVSPTRLEPGSATVGSLSAQWQEAVTRAAEAISAGRVVAAVGEPGSGRLTALAQAQRRVHPRDRILSASPPDPRDVEAWLSLWVPELAKPSTAVIACDVDGLATGVAGRLRDRLRQTRRSLGPFAPEVMPPEAMTPGLMTSGPDGAALAFTAERFEDIPAPLADLVGTVIRVPPLRERPEDIERLARHVAARTRGREVGFTPAARRALHDHSWPGNVDQLVRVVRAAASRTDEIDVRHLPPDVLSGTQRRLTRIEAFEREEIVRVLTLPGVTMKDAALELGMSRATIYRKIAQYDLRIPKP
jgi:transcriptional regulator of acetoin/glycerol metabolism